MVQPKEKSRQKIGSTLKTQTDKAHTGVQPLNHTSPNKVSGKRALKISLSRDKLLRFVQQYMNILLVAPIPLQERRRASKDTPGSAGYEGMLCHL